jgi:hypothetical protein
METIVSPSKIEATIQGEQTLSVPLSFAGKLRDVGLHNNSVYNFEIKYVNLKGDTVAETSVKGIELIEVLKCTKLTSAVEIDGVLNEWKELPYIVHPDTVIGPVNNYSGLKDSHMRFCVAYNEEFIYVAVDVIDDTVLVADRTKAVYAQDGIQLYIDPRPRKEREEHKEMDKKESPRILLSPAKNPEDVFFSSVLPSDMKCISRINKTGYSVEAAIPVRYLLKTQGKEWVDFALALFVNDIDKREHDKNSYGLRSSENCSKFSDKYGIFEREK